MIRIRHLTLARGGRDLLRDAVATINPGERIALVGPNGSGKSSLLAAFAGELLPDAGDIELPPGRLVKLSQTLPVGEVPASRHVLAADDSLVSAEAQVAAARRQADAAGDADDGSAGMALADALDRWSQAGGHSAAARIGELLAGLGFTPAQIEQPVAQLSGGWRMRLNLARALFAPGDLLLLDEPTNHLDLDAIVWLERWLMRFEGTVIVISHDRDFLDRIAQATLSIEDGKLVRYAGGYTAFESLRAQRAEQLARQADQQAERVASLTAFIDRFRAQATKARQVQSRIKALERMTRVAPLRAVRGVSFTIAPASDAPDPLIVAEGLSAGYRQSDGSGLAIVRHVDLLVPKGARIGVLGRNGAGKSTVIRTLVGELAALEGELRRARAMRVGYFAQHGVEQLRPDDTPLGLYRRTWPEESEAVLRAELGQYGFTGDHAVRPIGPMSGGEKARLLLGMILRVKPHLLVLDEPTNHLDADTRDTLTEALADFDGAVLLVSHDRYLMRATVDRLVLVHDGHLSPFEGDLDDYLGWLQERQAESNRSRSGAVRTESGGTDRTSQAGAQRSAPAAVVGASASSLDQDASSGTATAEPHAGLTPIDATMRQPPLDRREARRAEAARRQLLAARLKPIDAQIQAAETELAAVEAELAELERRFADPALYEDGAEAARMARRRGELDQQRSQLETRWIELSEQREQLALQP